MIEATARVIRVGLLLAVTVGVALAQPPPATGDILIDRAPLVIDRPGRYLLARDLRTTGTAIVVKASQVRIDLQGFRIDGPAVADTTAHGISIHDQSDVTVRNGAISGFQYGVYAGGREAGLAAQDPAAPSRIVVEHVQLSRNTFRGVRIGARLATVRECLVTDTGGCTVYPNAYAMGIEIVGGGAVVDRNVVSETMPVGDGEGVGISLSAYTRAAVVQGNIVTNARNPAPGRTFGVWVSGPPGASDAIVRDNVMTGFSYAFGGREHIALHGNVAAYTSCDIEYYALGEPSAGGRFLVSGPPSTFPCPDDPWPAFLGALRLGPADAFKLGQLAYQGRRLPRSVPAGFFWTGLASLLGHREATRQLPIMLRCTVARIRPWIAAIPGGWGRDAILSWLPDCSTQTDAP